MPVARIHQDKLSTLKDNVSNAYIYFQENYERYHEFRRYAFKTSLSDDMRAVLSETEKPPIEFNILEAYISRLLGEFSKHEPSIAVMAKDDSEIDVETIKVVDGHLRYALYESNKDSFAYEVYKDLLSGGFSVMKYWTEYSNNMSFNQVIRCGRVFDPTLCGFDPMAQYSHKGDGRFSFENFPKRVDELTEKYGNSIKDNTKFTRSIEGFNWSYRSDTGEDFLLLCDYYSKKKKRKKIVKLANGKVMTDEDYQKLEAYWDKQQIVAQMPAVIGKARITEIDTINRDVFIENEVLEHEETNYTYLPHIFVDGNSIKLRDTSQGNVVQMTRPYIYHAKGIQDLKNFAGQCLANELENMVQQKFIVMKEALPQEEEYLDAITNIQKGNTIVVNSYSENNPDKPIPMPIREVNRPPIPQEVTNTFSVTDGMSQTILGSYDAALGINDNQLSGVAIIEAATQSNAAAMPYMFGYLAGLTQLANAYVDLIPKYYVTPRTIPVVGIDGKKTYTRINGPSQPKLDYDTNVLDVKIEAGVNYAIAKNKALQQIIALSQASPVFAQFINTKGLSVILDNLEIKGVDQLKAMADEYSNEMQQQQAQAQQAQQQALENNPMIMRARNEQMKIMQQAKQDEMDNQLKIAEISIEKQNADTESIRAMNEAKAASVEASVQLEKANTERFSHAADLAARELEMKHSQTMDHHENARKHVELKHKIDISKNITDSQLQ